VVELDIITPLGPAHSPRASLGKGFHAACDDLKPARRFFVYSGVQRYPLGANTEAIGTRELMAELASMA
jgi:hypothetical protein